MKVQVHKARFIFEKFDSAVLVFDFVETLSMTERETGEVINERNTALSRFTCCMKYIGITLMNVEFISLLETDVVRSIIEDHFISAWDFFGKAVSFYRLPSISFENLHLYVHPVHQYVSTEVFTFA